MGNISVEIDVPDEQYEQLLKIAKEEGKSLSELAEDGLRILLEKSPDNHNNPNAL